MPEAAVVVATTGRPMQPVAPVEAEAVELALMPIMEPARAGLPIPEEEGVVVDMAERAGPEAPAL
jgi:hypothetical protein